MSKKKWSSGHHHHHHHGPSDPLPSGEWAGWKSSLRSRRRLALFGSPCLGSLCHHATKPFIQTNPSFRKKTYLTGKKNSPLVRRIAISWRWISFALRSRTRLSTTMYEYACKTDKCPWERGGGEKKLTSVEFQSQNAGEQAANDFGSRTGLGFEVHIHVPEV